MLFSKTRIMRPSLHVNHSDPALSSPHPALTDRKVEGHWMFFRILSKPHFVLILHVECLFAKNNLVSFQSYVALVLFSRMRKRKLNKISLCFPFSSFCMRLAVTWEPAFQSNCICGKLAVVRACRPPAGLKALAGAVSCGQDLFLIPQLFRRENPTRKDHSKGTGDRFFFFFEDRG